MIKRIKLLRNTGSFLSDDAAGQMELKRLVLIHAENGRGKTTLAAILRSLATGNPDLILERRRLGSTQPPYIVLAHEDFGSDVQFKDGAWTERIPYLRIYDDTFVNENVYSGLDVDSQHRQNLHQLILGEQGVSLNRQHQALVDQVEEHNRELRRKANRVPRTSLYGLDVDEFCALSQVPEIDAKIAEAEGTLAAARHQSELSTLPIFQNLKLPGFDAEKIQRLLSTDLSDLGQSAEVRVQDHVGSLGEDGESWVVDGMKYVETSGDMCPFCGQDLTFSDLIEHYRAYFSEAYSELKRSISQEIGSIEREHATGQQASFERSVRLMEQTRERWSPFLTLVSVSSNRVDLD